MHIDKNYPQQTTTLGVTKSSKRQDIFFLKKVQKCIFFKFLKRKYNTFKKVQNGNTEYPIYIEFQEINISKERCDINECETLLRYYMDEEFITLVMDKPKLRTYRNFKIDMKC